MQKVLFRPVYHGGDGMIYNDILERTGASSATISRVNRSLQYGADGYQTVLPRIKEKLKANGQL